MPIPRQRCNVLTYIFPLTANAEVLTITIIKRLTLLLCESEFTTDNEVLYFLDTDIAQKTSAKYMHRTLILRLILVFVSFILGTMAEYEQSFMLFLVFTVINGVTGGVIFLAHCFSNDVVNELENIFS